MNPNRIALISLFATVILPFAGCNQMPPIPPSQEAPAAESTQPVVAQTAFLVAPVFQTQTVDSNGDVGQYSSLVLNGAGNPVISYFDATRNDPRDPTGPNGNGDLKLMVCGNPTCTTGNTITTVDRGSIYTNQTGSYTSLVLDSRGYPVISYVDRDAGIKLAHCRDTTCTSRYNSIKVVKTNTSGFDLSSTSLVLDRYGNPVISYTATDRLGTPIKSTLQLAHCSDVDCNNVLSLFYQTVDAFKGVGQYTSLALDFYGQPVISYYDSGYGVLKLANCRNADCSSKSIQIVDQTGNVGQYNSLKMVPVWSNSGTITGSIPFISYYDATNKDLKVVSCGNMTCSSGNFFQTLDSAGDVGQHTSVTKSGEIYISYYDATNGDLKMAYCDPGTPAARVPTRPCEETRFNRLETADTTGNVGQYNSLVLDSNHNPVISYYDTSNKDLKLARK